MDEHFDMSYLRFRGDLTPGYVLNDNFLFFYDDNDVLA